jgi:DNA-binding PadR family transcriptional regulator
VKYDMNDDERPAFGRHGHHGPGARRAPWDDEDASGGRRRFGRGGPRGMGPRGGFGPRGGGRMKRGDIRTAVLVVLAEQPGHGYQIIQALEAKTEGAWRPSPGSVYPTLQLLEDSGLATSSEQDGKRIYTITDEGRAEAERKVDEAGRLPWEQGPQDGGLRGAMMQLAMATRQINAEGDPARIEQVIGIVNDARKQIYRILAED